MNSHYTIYIEFGQEIMQLQLSILITYIS